MNPSRVLAQVGIARDVFADPENRLSFAQVGRLVARCAEETGCAHFGLLLGERFSLADLGILGTLMRHSPTVRDALRHAVRHLALHDRAGLGLSLDLGGSEVAFGYSLAAPGVPAVDQILDGSIAICQLMVSELCGPAWRPRAVHLSHTRPRDVAPLRRFFGPRLEFDAPMSAVVFDARWLDHRIADADPAVFAATLERIRSIAAQSPTPFTDAVRPAIHALALTGSSPTASLANLFALHERTLRRQLAAEGATVRGLVNEARHGLASHLLLNTSLAVSEIAEILHYSGVPAFCRAFRARAGRSPADWRARAARR